MRHHRHHVYDLDLPPTLTSTSAETRIHQNPNRETPGVDQAAAMNESRNRLEQAMLALSPRLRLVAEGIRDGKSYSEIGAYLGVSKQAAHKLAGAAISSLREALAAMGFSGLDTVGLLKSHPGGGCGVPPQAVQKASVAFVALTKQAHLPISASSSPQVDDFPPQP